MESIRELLSRAIPSCLLKDDTFWRNIGIALRCITSNPDLFIEKCVGYRNEKECRDLWSTIKTNLPKKTLDWYAKAYDPEEYKDWYLPRLADKMENAIDSQTDLDMAEMIHESFKLKFACFKNEWYIYEEGIFIKTPKSTLWEHVKLDILSILDELKEDKTLQLEDSEDMYKGEVKQIRAYIKNIVALSKKLKTLSYMNKLTKMCKELFSVEDLTEYSNMISKLPK